MCQVLIQVYACGHMRPICITPCLEATAASQKTEIETRRRRRPSPPTSPYARPSSSATMRQLPQRRRESSLNGQGASRQPSSSYWQLQQSDLPEWLTLMPSYDPNMQYCPGYYPRNLPSSNWPCLHCYMQPEWGRYRQTWVRRYQEYHPEATPDEAEEMSGVALIPERAGLLNIVQEMDRMRSTAGSQPGRKGGGEASQERRERRTE